MIRPIDGTHVRECVRLKRLSFVDWLSVFVRFTLVRQLCNFYISHQGYFLFPGEFSISLNANCVSRLKNGKSCSDITPNFHQFLHSGYSTPIAMWL